MKKTKANLKNMLTPGDLSAIGDLMGGLIDGQSAVLRRDLASKEDLKSLKVELTDYMDQGFESVIAGIDAVAEKLTEKEKFDRLVEWAKEVGNKVGVKVKI